jgi:hypothetical protein
VQKDPVREHQLKKPKEVSKITNVIKNNNPLPKQPTPETSSKMECSNTLVPSVVIEHKPESPRIVQDEVKDEQTVQESPPRIPMNGIEITSFAPNLYQNNVIPKNQ